MDLTVEDLLLAKKETLELELLAGEAGLQRPVGVATVSNPGLVLAGFTERFPGGRVQVLGETELAYLRSRDPDQLRESLETLLKLEMPAVVVTKGLAVPDLLIELAEKHGVPLIRSTAKTADVFRRLQGYLEGEFAPSTTLHGSMADVYGVGLVFVGQSGIGKSECVLDLVERGHRLVADDLVHVSRRGANVLIGKGHELQRHHMEIRGIGIIDIPVLFGVRSIRQQKRIEVVVQLEEWDEDTAYDRTGLEGDEVEILDVAIPKVTVPLNPGKNITVISEVVAMNHLLRYSGIRSAELFDQRIREAMRPVREYLEEDYE